MPDPMQRTDATDILARAISRVVDAQTAAEAKGDGRTTVSTADLKLVMRMFATMYRREVANAPR